MTSKIGCNGEPNQETAYYMATNNSHVYEYQKLTVPQFLEVSHLFPTKCFSWKNIFQSDHKDICGIRKILPRQRRIVGGEEASYGDWPWQVLDFLKLFKLYFLDYIL